MYTYRYHSARVLMMSMYNKIHAGKSCMYIAHAHMHTQSHTHTHTHRHTDNAPLGGNEHEHALVGHGTRHQDV